MIEPRGDRQRELAALGPLRRHTSFRSALSAVTSIEARSISDAIRMGPAAAVPLPGKANSPVHPYPHRRYCGTSLRAASAYRGVIELTGGRLVPPVPNARLASMPRKAAWVPGPPSRDWPRSMDIEARRHGPARSRPGLSASPSPARPRAPGFALLFAPLSTSARALPPAVAASVLPSRKASKPLPAQGIVLDLLTAQSQQHRYRIMSDASAGASKSIASASVMAEDQTELPALGHRLSPFLPERHAEEAGISTSALSFQRTLPRSGCKRRRRQPINHATRRGTHRTVNSTARRIQSRPAVRQNPRAGQHRPARHDQVHPPGMST